MAAVLQGAMGKASAKTGPVGWGGRDRDRSQHHGWGPRAACTEPHTQEDPRLGSTFRCRHLKIPNNFLIELGQWGMCVGRRDAHHVSFHIPRHRSLMWHSRSPARGIPVGPLGDRRSSSEHQGSRSRLRPPQAEFPTAPRDRASRQNQNLHLNLITSLKTFPPIKVTFIATRVRIPTSFKGAGGGHGFPESATYKMFTFTLSITFRNCCFIQKYEEESNERRLGFGELTFVVATISTTT